MVEVWTEEVNKISTAKHDLNIKPFRTSEGSCVKFLANGIYNLIKVNTYILNWTISNAGKLNKRHLNFRLIIIHLNFSLKNSTYIDKIPREDIKILKLVIKERKDEIILKVKFRFVKYQTGKLHRFCKSGKYNFTAELSIGTNILFQYRCVADLQSRSTGKNPAEITKKKRKSSQICQSGPKRPKLVKKNGTGSSSVDESVEEEGSEVEGSEVEGSEVEGSELEGSELEESEGECEEGSDEEKTSELVETQMVDEDLDGEIDPRIVAGEFYLSF